MRKVHSGMKVPEGGIEEMVFTESALCMVCGIRRPAVQFWALGLLGVSVGSHQAGCECPGSGAARSMLVVYTGSCSLGFSPGQHLLLLEPQFPYL